MRILKTLAAQDWFRAILGWLIQFYIRLIWRTGRWRVEGATDHLAAWDQDKPFILCFWHGRLLMIPLAWRRGKSMQMLISAHRDGRLIAEAMQYFAIGTRAGSTKRGGAEALRVMLRTLGAGNSVGITPDGPRGPRMRASPGVVAAARLSGVPIIPVTFGVSRRRILRSWDRFVLALPFGRGVFLWGEAIHVPRDGDLETYRQRLEQAMNLLSAEADRRCGQVPIEPGPPPGDGPIPRRPGR
ncbi:hypothetical protein EDC65_2997 [Stella humosa]|uniref:DUF374 domain-containing protein n=1 Tax=Stella humosa TaxID=94 RepID=A0A3N1LJ06_9PROT|nr:lysophospholipid acyltransferase family protein [Stella humosa]ROP91134.1 hypothetical protein EDC65_2997 [Stella humosa]BBK34514.1 hypothetical protein STHU_51480 [Stella humosa]